MENLTLEEESKQPEILPTDPAHPKNQVAVHNLVIDGDLEATKEYDDLDTAWDLGVYLNKRMKLVKAFKKPEFDWNDEKIKSDKNADKHYYTTYRNGFVSAMAMSYNFHLPLVLSPVDIWLCVLQGFKLHMRLNAEKDFVKLSFRNLKSLDKTVQKTLKVECDLDKIDDHQFQELLLTQIEKAIDTIWNEKHLGQDFQPCSAEQGLPQIDKNTDMFKLELSSEVDIKLPGLKAKWEKYEKEMQEHEEYQFDKPEDLPEEE